MAETSHWRAITPSQPPWIPLFTLPIELHSDSPRWCELCYCKTVLKNRLVNVHVTESKFRLSLEGNTPYDPDATSSVITSRTSSWRHRASAAAGEQSLDQLRRGRPALPRQVEGDAVAQSRGERREVAEGVNIECEQARRCE